MKKSHLALGFCLLACLSATLFFARPTTETVPNTAAPSQTQIADSQSVKQSPRLDAEPASTPELPATAALNESTRAEVPVVPALSDPTFNADARLIVLVQDHAGSPVENVAIEWILELTATGELNDKNISGTTNAAGMIEVEKADRYLDAIFSTDQPSLFNGMVSRIGLRCTLPFNEYKEDAAGVFWLTEEPTQGVPVVLTLPPSGWVQFEFDPIQDGTGQTLDVYFLHIRRSDGDYYPGWRDGFYLEPGQTSKRYGPIGLNWEVYGSIGQSQVIGSLGHVRAPGPTQPGEITTIKIPFGTPESPLNLATVEGIAQDELGQALSERSLNVTLRNALEGNYVGGSVRTDKHGRWSISTSINNLGSKVTLEARHDELKPMASATLAKTSASQTHFNQGPMRLVPTHLPKQPKSLVVSGTVLDAGGAPIQRAYVTAKAKLLSLDGKPVEDPSALTTIAWSRTHKDGSFTIEALAEYATGTLQVTVSESDYFDAPAQEVTPGATDLTFTLTKGASVTLQLKLDPWVIMTDKVSLRFKGPGTSSHPSYGDFLGHYGGHFGGLKPGTYTLTIELSGSKVPLHKQTVEVTGQPVLDLGPLDMRGKLTTCNLTVLDTNGQPVERQYLSLYDPTTKQRVSQSNRSSKAGHANFILPAGTGDLILGGSNRHSASIPTSLFFQPGPGKTPPRTTVTLAP